MRNAIPTWEILKQYLEEQIGTGIYPVGSWLPSVRDMAAELRVNRNTVSKVYQALGREGVLQVARGKGVRVVSRPAETRTAATRIDSAIHALVREASVAGLSRDWLQTRVAANADEVYGNRLVRMAFIECTPTDARQIAADLGRQLEIPVTPVDLADLPSTPDFADGYDLVTTTFFHLQEVSALLPETEQATIVGLNHTVSHESVLEVARLRPGSTIAIVCPNQRSLDRVRGIVETYARGEIYAFVADKADATLKKTLTTADVAVDMSMTHDLIRKMAPGTPTITVSFHIDRQSIDYLRGVVHRVSRRLAGSPGEGVAADALAMGAGLEAEAAGRPGSGHRVGDVSAHRIPPFHNRAIDQGSRVVSRRARHRASPDPQASGGQLT